MSATPPPDLTKLQAALPQVGTVRWIGVRPARKAPLEEVLAVVADPATGLQGDHHVGRSGKRQVTLIDAAHLAAVATYLRQERIEPGIVRRNIVIAGVNLLALKGRRFALGEALLEYTGACHPCSRMEAALGPGGYNAMRGHGGICARVLRGGTIRVGDRLVASCPEGHGSGAPGGEVGPEHQPRDAPLAGS